jgi:hypothetical protein
MFCILVLTLREAVSRPVDEYSVNIATGIYWLFIVQSTSVAYACSLDSRAGQQTIPLPACSLHVPEGRTD